MYSSTSSFSRELKVIGVALLTLLCAELAIRLYGSQLSRDLQHINTIPAASQMMLDHSRYRILFLGNSATHEGVDPAVIQPELEKYMRRSLQIERVYPDDTTIAEWYYVFKHHFADKGRLPDLLVINFVYNYQARDGESIKTEAIAANYSSLRDMPTVFAEDIPDFEQRASFFLSNFSAAAANRERVSLRVLDQVIPYYRAGARQMNASRNQAKQQTTVVTSYHRLARLLKLANKLGVQVLVAAMPTRNGYALDPAIQASIEQAGGKLLDCRAVAGLEASHYQDDLHLNQAGARIYSHYLAAQLKQHLLPVELVLRDKKQ